MKISIVVPYYNESLTLKKTLMSLTNQTLAPYEVLLVDSGSTDKSTSIIKEFIEKNNIRNIKTIYSGQMTPSNSINLGVRNSSGDLIAYIDCGLDIPKNWLESNYELLICKKIDIISPRVYTDGDEIIDRAFIAHTMGYMSYTPCLTGSLMKKKIIEDVNYFLENARASYDVDFVKKTKAMNFTRLVNDKVTLRYYGTNFCNTLSGAILKISKYSENGWRVNGHFKPYLYIFFLILVILGFYYGLGLSIIILYLSIRGYLVPILKSSSKIFKDIKLLLILPIVGFTIDISRIIGYLFIHKVINLQWESSN